MICGIAGSAFHVEKRPVVGQSALLTFTLIRSALGLTVAGAPGDHAENGETVLHVLMYRYIMTNRIREIKSILHTNLPLFVFDDSHVLKQRIDEELFTAIFAEIDELESLDNVLRLQNCRCVNLASQSHNVILILAIVYESLKCVGLRLRDRRAECLFHGIATLYLPQEPIEF